MAKLDDRERLATDAPTLVGAGDGVAPTIAPTDAPVARVAPVLGADGRGEVVGDRYQLGATLGEGGMGEVVLAFDARLGRDVAVKRVRPEVRSPDLIARFMREALVQARLEHPAIVPIHDLAADDTGQPYFVMKRLVGTTMSDLIDQLRGDHVEVDVASTRRRLLRAFADVCLAIEFVHSRGVIHRDLKPANIMLGDFGEIYVIDWGIARAVSEPDDSGTVARPSLAELKLGTGETREGAVMGTPAYMAPEQLAGEQAGPAADVYALGCILFEIAAGAMLHRVARTIGASTTEIDARPSRVRSESPPELDAICQRATRLERAARYRSARELGNAVQAFLDGDRDVAVRKELAASHLEAARAALSRGNDAASRRIAMAEAGRALALDPTAAAAAELVTELMLRPPDRIPAAVEARLLAIDTDTGREQGRLGALAMLGYIAFVPFMLWTGAADLRFVAAFVSVALISGAQMWWMIRGSRISPAAIYVNAAINAVLIALVSRVTGLFMLAPTLVLTTLMAYSVHSQLGRIRWLAPILGSGIAVPWLLELLGVLERTYHFRDGELDLSSQVVTYRELPVSAGLAVALAALIATVGILSRNLAHRQRDAARQLELQAWQLRQIVPTGTTVED